MKKLIKRFVKMGYNKQDAVMLARREFIFFKYNVK